MTTSDTGLGQAGGRGEVVGLVDQRAGLAAIVTWTV
jgi:hypothetical protein